MPGVAFLLRQKNAGENTTMSVNALVEPLFLLIDGDCRVLTEKTEKNQNFINLLFYHEL